MGDLLKEAIADAKAVRETALANAKMALEEAFTPQLKSMLSAKLREEDDELEAEVPAEEGEEGSYEEDEVADGEEEMGDVTAPEEEPAPAGAEEVPAVPAEEVPGDEEVAAEEGEEEGCDLYLEAIIR